MVITTVVLFSLAKPFIEMMYWIINIFYIVKIVFLVY